MSYSATNTQNPQSILSTPAKDNTLAGYIQRTAIALEAIARRYLSPYLFATFAGPIPDQECVIVYLAANNVPGVSPVIERITMQNSTDTTIIGIYLISGQFGGQFDQLPPVPTYYVYPGLSADTVILPGLSNYSVVAANISGNAVSANVSVVVSNAS